ncbi:hypothetical protein AVEN_47724-1 [Araneus ventricosus]|uniref:Uncharacterized protein n=1 Tax=Araneus ventricosus TaxID=182803 RepID=A0A4Y2T3E3_ARAVE|nr:hypothetical protein AVEN_47724-1 [Araneus ventricosus]
MRSRKRLGMWAWLRAKKIQTGLSVIDFKPAAFFVRVARPGRVHGGRGGLVVRSRPRDQASSRWCGAKIPTLARPTQEGCKAGEAYKHSLFQFSPIATYNESDWTSECEVPSH